MRELAKEMRPPCSTPMMGSGAASTRVRKRASLRASALATCVRSVMSRAIADAPMIVPSWSRRGDTVRETATRVPSARSRSVS